MKTIKVKISFLLALCLANFAISQNLSDEYKLSLPWTEGEYWYLLDGVHPSALKTDPDRSSIDFGPAPGASRVVRAAREGIAITNCHAQVFIKHTDVNGEKFYTSYYHLVDIPENIPSSWPDAKYVKRGDIIGYVAETLDEAICDMIGTWDNPHVHFTIRNGTGIGQYRNLENVHIGGWKVLPGNRDSGIQRKGITVLPTIEDSDFLEIFSPTAIVYNDGAIGIGNFDNYPECRDVEFNSFYPGRHQIVVTANRDITINSSPDFHVSGKFIAGGSFSMKKNSPKNIVFGEGLSFEIANFDECEEQPPRPLERIRDVTDDEISDRFRIFPNPSSSVFRITYEFNSERQYTYNVLSLSDSKLVQSGLIVPESPLVNIHSLPAGLYLFSLFENDQKIEIEKLLIR